MNRRKFLRTGTTIGGLALFAGGPLTHWLTATPVNAAGPPHVTSRHVPSGNIRDYLSREARRITDLTQVAGLLWPTELVFVGNTPPTYGWTEAAYRRLGAPGRATRVADVGNWRPE